MAWVCLTAVGALEPLERLSAQARYLLRPVQGMSAPLTVVAIDERALRSIGQMPWDRRVFARLLDRLADAHAAVVGIDVAFNEPAREASQDDALAKALKRLPTVLPTFLAYADAGRGAQTAIEPLPKLAEAAAALGNVQLSSQQQSQVWEIEPYQTIMQRLVPAFPVAVVGVYRGHPWKAAAPGFPWRESPTLIAFRGPASTARQVSASDLLDGKVPASDLADRIVLIGATAAGLPDTNFAVPDFRGGPMAGVELFAHAIDDMLAGGFQRRTGLPAVALLLLGLAFFPGRRLADRVRGRRAAWLLGPLALWLLLSVVAFRFGIWLDVLPVAGFLLSCTLWGVFSERAYLLESKNQLLARYASDIASEAQRQRARIEGELHDNLQQLMVVATREARQALKLELPARAAEHLHVLEDIALEAHEEVRRLRADLLPTALREGGLVDALTELVHDPHARGPALTLEVLDWEAPAHDLEVELYWLVKEALNNVEKHAGAGSVRLRLDGGGHGKAVVEVIDDGQGFTPPDPSIPPVGMQHTGLHRMWLRARGNRGDLQIISSPGRGTCLRLTMPVEARRSSV